MNIMVCPFCNAEVGNGSTCQYCGRKISYSMKKEQEQLNKSGCPKCGSSNIVFNREKRSENKDETGISIVRETVGMCKDCGYTWIPNASNQATVTSETTKQKDKPTWKTWLLGFAWVFFFPVVLSVYIYRSKKLKEKTKQNLIALVWVCVIAFVLFNKLTNSEEEETITETMSVEQSIDESVDDVQSVENTSLDENGTVPEVEEYHSNATINQVLADYNAIAEFTFSPDEIEDGAYESATIHINDVRISVDSTKSSDNIFGNDDKVDIELSWDEDETVYAIFRDFVKSLNDSVTEDKIEVAWAALQTDQYEYYADDYILDNIELNYNLIKYESGNSYKIFIKCRDYEVE